jgi:hypothetical protein
MKLKFFAVFVFVAAASLRLSADKKFAYLNFTGLKDTSKISYVLTYDTNRGQKGLEGGMKLKKTSRSSRKQILGTCSSGKCVYHQGIKNVELTTTFVNKNGTKTTTTTRVP